MRGSRATRAHAARFMFLGSACVAVLLGCGSDRVPNGATGYAEASRAAVLTQADIDRHAPGSPEERALRWWRALQFRDGADALAMYGPDIHRKLLEQQFDIVIAKSVGPWTASVRPVIEAVERRGPRATVFLRLEVIAPVGKTFRRSDQYLGVSMYRAGPKGPWLLSDSSYLSGLAQVLANPTGSGSPR
jgi:hypothetical protein